jgi:opacity protein-like surface antigen
MKRTLTSFSLAFGIAAALNLGALTPTAQAADFGAAQAYAQGINPYGAVTPVPAPIPVPVFEPAWYFRADFAAGFGSQPSISTTGTPFGSGTAFQSIGLDQGWLSEDFLPSFTGGVGVGYVWGAHFRTDFTVDVHSIMDASFNGSQTYNDPVLRTVTVQDKTRFMSTILLMNAYYDFRTGTAFSPYVGGGVGFAVNQLTRSSSSTDSGAQPDVSVSDRTTRINFAGAAMAGITYDINSIVSLDVGYRYLYIGGTDIDLNLNGSNSDVSVGGISEQQVRAGLRFYID